MKQKLNSLLLVGIIFVAMNLRAPITSVGPLISLMTKELSLSSAQAGLVTTIPLIMFAIISPLAPKIAEKRNIESVIFVALFAVLLGLIVRSVPNIVLLFLGTAILGCGIAVCNVLIPSLVKKEFSSHIGLVTGIYSVSMNLTGAVASGLSIPFVQKFGLSWNVALGVWLIITIIAIITWLPQFKYRDKLTKKDEVEVSSSMWHSSLAWSVTLFMGIQSFIFYVLVAWMPEMLVDKGMSTTQAGSMLSLLQLILLPVTFIVPLVAEKKQTQKSYVMIAFILFLCGILGLMTSNQVVIIIGIMMIGIAGGTSFSLSMIFFSLRTTSSKQAAALSGMAQSIGYLFAATGPFLFGMLHDMTGNWQSSLIVLVVVTFVLLFVGLKAGSKEVVN